MRLRKGYRFGALFALVALVSASPASADFKDLPPRSDWTVDYADESCALQRDFGAGDEVVHLEFRQFAPDTPMQVLVASPTLGVRRVAFIPRIHFSSDAQPHVPQGYLRVSYPGGVRGVMFIDTLRAGDDRMRYHVEQSLWPAEDRAGRERAITWIAVEDTFRDDVRLATGNLHAPMEALRTCLDELLTHWGIDAVAHRSLLRPVRPLAMEAWSQDVREVYPREKLGARQNARLRIRLEVSADGRAVNCHMQHMLGEEGFEQTACNVLIANARFEPALDADGRLCCVIEVGGFPERIECVNGW